MVAMTNQQRQETRKEFCYDSYHKENDLPFSLTKPELIQLIGEIDDWIDANQASFIGSLTPDLRSQLTGPQLVLAFMHVVKNRFNVGA